MTTPTTVLSGFGRKLLLGLACCTVAGCWISSGGSASSASGGAGAGTAGSAEQSMAGMMSSAGAVNSAGAGGASVGTAGDASGGSFVATAGSAVDGGAGMGGSSLGGNGGGGMASGGAGGSGGSGTCAGVFCDGFEASTKLGSAWTVDNAVAANVVEVVSDKAHTGTNSVHMKFATNSGATFIHETMGFPAQNNSLWGRVWLYVMTAPANGHDVYIETSNGQNTTNTGLRALNTIGKNMDINVDPGVMAEDNNSANMPLPHGMWTCFEWQIAATGGMGSVTLFMNGTQVAKIANTKIPNFVYQRVGYEHYAADSTGGDMWIDDYALGTSRITCN